MRSVSPPKGYRLIKAPGGTKFHLTREGQDIEPICGAKPSRTALKHHPFSLWSPWPCYPYHTTDPQCLSCWALSGNALNSTPQATQNPP